jgi:phage gp29-like protein
MKKSGLWVTPTSYIEFADSGKTMSSMIATRERSIDYLGMMSYLPNPDVVLKKLNKDITVYRDLLVDAHVAACAGSRLSGVKSLKWEIDRGMSKNRQAKFIQDVFEDMDVMSLVSEILDAPFFGYQPLEITWQTGRGSWLPKKIEGKPPEWFVFGQQNELRFRSKANYIEGEELPARKFLLARHRATYANPYGSAVLAPVFWPVFFKKGGWKSWVVFCEKYGMPYLLGKHAPGASDAERHRMLDMLERLVADGIAVIADNSNVEFLEHKAGTASTELYKTLVDACNTEMSKAILGHGAAADSTPGRLGGERDAMAVRKDLIDGDKEIVCRVFNELIDWLVDFNFGDVDRPKFVMYEEEDVDAALSERDKNLTDGGRVKLTKVYYQRAYGFKDDEIEIAEPPTPGAKQPPAEFSALASTDEQQQAIDELVAALPPSQLQGAMEQILEPIMALAESAESYDAMSAGLARLYPELDDSRLRTILERGMFVAEAWGRSGQGA